MVPDQVKKEEEVADKIEAWSTERQELQLLDPERELKMPFLKSAFKRMLPDEMNKHMDNNMQGKDFGEIKQFM